MSRILETERLLLRKFVHSDASFILELVNSPGWLEFIGDKNIKSTDDATNYLENGPLKSYKEHGFGLYLVANNVDGQSIGMCGILKRDYLEHPDIGFALLPGFTGVGYAFEMTQATLVYAAQTISLEQIYAITLPHNLSSIRVLEKVGMTFVKKIHPVNTAGELHLYHRHLDPLK